MKLERELMRGAGPLAVMQLLSSGEKYGYELVERLARDSDNVLKMGQSTLYPMLYNLEAKKLIRSRLDTAGARPRRYYRLTAKGKKQLARDAEQWQLLTRAMQSLGIATNPSLSMGG